MLQPHASWASILEQLLKAIAPLKTLPKDRDDFCAADKASGALPQGVVGGNGSTGEDEKGSKPSSELAA